MITINGSSQSYSVSTAGNITTYTFNSGVGSVAYDDGAKNIVVTVTIPEPASMLSLAIGGTALVGLTRLRSRRRK